jgi:hypothetical protein
MSIVMEKNLGYILNILVLGGALIRRSTALNSTLGETGVMWKKMGGFSIIFVFPTIH